MSDKDQNDAVKYIAKVTGVGSAEGYAFTCSFLFDNIALAGKRVLDIGCGTGQLALWAGLKNASYVLGIEPERAGSTPNTLQIFQRAVDHLKFTGRVEPRGDLFQDLTDADGLFDVAVMYDVINHIDESAVTRLHKDAESIENYVAMLMAFRKRLSVGAYVIVSDSARDNFWNHIHVKNPFAPTVNWSIHQNPEIWIDIFSRAGFSFHDLRWYLVRRLRWSGRFRSSRLLNYFLRSHFTLRFRNPS